MRNVLDVLGNDRSLIKIGGYVVSGGTDNFYAAKMRLVVRFGAFEAREKCVMNIDASPRQVACHVVREDLHIPRQDDEFCS